jgi:hypothetical protein
MQSFTLKYYPPKVLIGLVVLFVTLFFAIKSAFYNFQGTEVSLAGELGILLGSTTVVSAGVFLINNYIMWPWLLKLLGIPDLRGTYEGKLVSSYHIDDDPEKPHVTKYLVLTISQNLNGFYVRSKFYDRKSNSDFSSQSESLNHAIKPDKDGTYIIEYLYRNLPNTLHKAHKRDVLNTHQGICVLRFNPKDRSLEGRYFNDTEQRPSYGKINLTPKHD